MRMHYLTHPWIDDDFLMKGSFISTDGGRSLLLLKGGETNHSKLNVNHNAPSIFIKKFYSDDYIRHVSNMSLKTKIEDLRRTISYQDSDLGLSDIEDFDDVFCDDFQSFKQEISQGLKKAVLISRKKFRTDNPQKLIMHLMAKAIEIPSGKAYGFWDQNRGIIGCTPETLFESTDETLLTEALAGTSHHGQEQQLLNSIKDRIEHEFVIKDICEKLQLVGLSPETHETSVASFGKISHLRTKITAKMHTDLSASILGEILSPTAALGGYPKERALPFLKNSKYAEKFPDRIFGSFIGTDHEERLGLVMIRNIQWEGETFFIESGVGVVAESVLENELQEISFKRKIIQDHYL